MKAKHWLIFILLGAIWSSSFMWIKIAVQEIGPMTLVAFRALFGLLFGVVVILVGRVPEEVYEQARQQFSDEELVKLMIAIVTINAWNRFTIFGDVPGSYQPSHFVTQPGQIVRAQATDSP